MAYFCDTKGRLLSEASITRLAADRFWLLSAAAAETFDYDWLSEHLPEQGVSISNLTGSHTTLHLAGPASRSILEKITDSPLDNKHFPWLSARSITIGMARVMALRVSFTGELGYELHLPSEYAQGVYQRIG